MSIPEESIVSGKRDYVRYFENSSFPQQLYYPLDEVLNYMISDDRNKMQRANNNELVNVYPVKKFSVEVDKNAVINTGYVPKDDENKIVDMMKWDIGRNGLSKGDIVVLDIIATNAKQGWKRPIYWTTTTGSSVYMNLDKYLRHNGLTYQLLPIEANSRMRGMDDMDLLYDRMMNTYVWGRMDEGELFLDDKAQLVPQNMRSMFIQVADYFSNVGKMDSAVALIDKCYTVMPESILPMNLRLKAASAEIYYKAGNMEKGDQFTQEVGDDAVALVRYYKRFKTKGVKSVEGEKRDNLDVLRNIGPMANKYNRAELGKKYSDLYTQLNDTY
jgi:hypothetical protein